MANIYNKINNVIVQLSLPFSLFFNFFIFIFAVSKSTVSTRQQLASVAGFLSLTIESHTIPVPQLITTDCGVHLIPLTKEIGEIVVSITVVFVYFSICCPLVEICELTCSRAESLARLFKRIM